MNTNSTYHGNSRVSARLLVLLATSAALFTIHGCGTRTENTRTETEKTTVIERKVEVPAPQRDGYMQRAGERVDQKIEDAIDSALN